MDAEAFTAAVKAELAEHDARVPEQRAGWWTGADASGLAGLAFIRNLVAAWDCCGTCAGGLLLRHDEQVRAQALADHRGREAG